MKKNVESNIFFEVQKYYFVFKSRLIFFSNGHIRNVVSTLPNVVKIDVEKHNVVSTLFYVVNFNVDIHNVVSTLIWRCAMSRCHINLKTTLNRRCNACWDCWSNYCGVKRVQPKAYGKEVQHLWIHMCPNASMCPKTSVRGLSFIYSDSSLRFHFQVWYMPLVLYG